MGTLMSGSEGASRVSFLTFAWVWFCSSCLFRRRRGYGWVGMTTQRLSYGLDHGLGVSSLVGLSWVIRLARLAIAQPGDA